jgi:hypothetical protein
MLPSYVDEGAASLVCLIKNPLMQWKVAPTNLNSRKLCNLVKHVQINTQTQTVFHCHGDYVTFSMCYDVHCAGFYQQESPQKEFRPRFP